MELTPGWASVGLTAAGIMGGGIAAWLRSIDSAQEKRITEVKSTQKIMFAKLDEINLNLQSYKLRVSEVYVSREILREQLQPINRMLESIQHDLRSGPRP